MQTIPVNSKLATKALSPVPASSSSIEPPPLAVLAPLPETLAQPAAAVRERAKINPHAELDEMLRRDPNVGALHGMRFALLFNAGLALSGILVWELWSLLVP